MSANEADIDASAAARLEHRLTKLEQTVLAAQHQSAEGFTGVHDRLDRLNGSVARHEGRLNIHDVDHAKASGASEERMRLRLLDRSLLLVTLLTSVGASIVAALRV